MTEGAYGLNRKSTSKQALVVLIKTCFAFTGFYCAFHKHANSEVQKPTDDCVFHCREIILMDQAIGGLGCIFLFTLVYRLITRALQPGRVLV